MKNRNLFPKFLFGLTICAIIVGLLLGIFLPWILDACYGLRSETIFEGYRIAHQHVKISGLLILLYITYVPFMIIWAAVFKLCRNLANNVPFCDNSILNLKVIGISAFFDSLVFFAGIFLFNDGFIVFIVLTVAALMISVISAIIRELVIRGIELREEVDLTV